MTMGLNMNLFVSLVALLYLVDHTSALSSAPKRPTHEALVNRRGVIEVAAGTILASSVSVPMASAASAEAFVGTYSDPINHPGGTRTVRLVGEKVGDYQLAEVVGGGGRGEPQNYILPAVIFGDRLIVIDFSVAPKYGPRDFSGVLTEKGIKFLRDGNLWPRI